MKLSDISEIIIGTLISREEAKESLFTYKVLNIKALDQASNDYQTIFTKKEITKTITQKNDIIIRLTSPVKILLIDDTTQNLIVPSQMCIIRIKDQTNPIFLKWYLESSKFQEQISLNLVGTSIKKLSVTTLKNLIIPKIPINIQNKISELIKTWEQEKKLSLKIIENKELYYNQVIEDIIKGYDNYE